MMQILYLMVIILMVIVAIEFIPLEALNQISKRKSKEK